MKAHKRNHANIARKAATSESQYLVLRFEKTIQHKPRKVLTTWLGATGDIQTTNKNKCKPFSSVESALALRKQFRLLGNKVDIEVIYP